MKKYSTQEVIDMAADLYDRGILTRVGVRRFLESLLDTGSAEFDLYSMYDLIVG